MVSPAVPFDVHVDDVDGTPVFWGVGSGPLTAALVFRVGAADEPAHLHGISHVVEHLALAQLGVPPYDFNGMVEPIRTTFVVSGSEDEVGGFLASVTSALRDLPSDRVFREREVLGQESDEEPRSIDARLRFSRYGAIGHGVAGIDQYALAWVGPASVREWAERWFTRGNAALVLNRAPWPGLRLSLNPGERHPPRHPEPLPEPATPFLIRWELPDEIITLSAPHSTALLMASDIVRRRALAALRFEDGIAYDIGYNYELLDRFAAHVLWGARGSGPEVGRISTRLLSVYDRMIAEGPTDRELGDQVADVGRRLQHPDGQVAYLAQCAFDHLLGGVPRSVEEVVANRAQVTPELAKSVLEAARQSMILAVPFASPPVDGFAELSRSDEPVRGTRFTRRGIRFPIIGGRHELILSDEAITALEPGSPPMTIRFSDLAVALHQLGDRLLLTKDGWFLGILAAQWKDSEKLVRLIDSRTPAPVIACWKCNDGGLAGPEALENPTLH